MRHININNRCIEWDQFLENYAGRLTAKNWGNFTQFRDKQTKELVGKIAKQFLVQQMYVNQKGLCIYCEQQLSTVTGQNSVCHVEHIWPKNEYPQYRFQFENLSLSCNGHIITEDTENGLKKSFCGHFIKNDIKIQLLTDDCFLHPYMNVEIGSFFEYDIEGNIKPNTSKSLSDQSKARKMILELSLNDSALLIARRESYSNLINIEIEFGTQDVNDLLDISNIPLLPFYSMLIQFF